MTLRRRAEGLVDASSSAGRHPVSTSTDVRIRGRAKAPDVRIAADADAVRADANRHRGVDAMGLLPVALLLAAALAGLLAAAILLAAAAVLRPEQAAARERRRKRSGRDRNLNRLSDDLLVHNAPLVSFCFCRSELSSVRPPGQIRSSSRRRAL